MMEPRTHDVYGFPPGSRDDDAPEPRDDAESFDCRDGQARARSMAHTRRAMEVTYNAIWGPQGTLAAYARTLVYVTVPRER